jgi:uncharacterized damage-inducible protein DinB
VIEILTRAFQAVRKTFTEAEDAVLDQGRHFFGKQTTVRRVYLRLLTHTHEHMGQMIPYMRMSGMTAPWPDWRPDRRPSR